MARGKRRKSTSTRKRSRSTGRSTRKPAGMAHKGSKCKRFKVVYSKTLGRKVRRCAQF